MADNRRHKRATAQGLASYVWVGSKLSSSIIENISAGGLFYRTPKPVAPGTAVKIRLVQPGLKEAIELTGNVVSSIDPATAVQHGIIPGAGIRFDPVPDAQRERFNALLASLGLPPIGAAPEAPPELPLDALIPVEPSAQPAPPASFEPSPSYSYRIFKAEAQVEVPKRPVPPAPAAAAAPEPRMQPQPIEFEIAPVKPTASKKADDAEKLRLMEHIQGLLKQLTGLQEDLRQRDQDLRQRDQDLRQRDQDLRQHDQDLRARDEQLRQHEAQMAERNQQLAALRAENAELGKYLTLYKRRFGPL